MKPNYRYWYAPLNGATKNWQERVMWYGAVNNKIKIVHVNDGNKFCCIEVRKNYSNVKLKALFKDIFGISVIGNEIKHRM